MRTLLAPLVPAVLLGAVALAGCDDGDASGAASDTARRTSSSQAADHSPSDVTSWPDDVEAPVQGGRYTAVVLATGEPSALEPSVASARERGYVAGVSDPGCLQGVVEVVGPDAGGLVSSVLFARPADAREFATAWGAEGLPVVGTADVTAYCLD